MPTNPQRPIIPLGTNRPVTGRPGQTKRPIINLHKTSAAVKNWYLGVVENIPLGQYQRKPSSPIVNTTNFRSSPLITTLNNKSDLKDLARAFALNDYAVEEFTGKFDASRSTRA